MTSSATANRLRAGFRLPVVTIAAVTLWAAFAVAVLVRTGGPLGVRRIDDLGQLASAAAAAVGAAVAAARGRGRLRASWLAICVGASCWALGQAVWCYDELVAHQATPFPSLADVGYLLFPVGAAVGMWLFPAIAGAQARWRWLLDAGTVVTALVAVSWATTLGAMTRNAGSSAGSLVVSLAYPISDILILTMAVSGMIRPSPHRRQLVLMSAAMAAMAMADSSFAYLVATGRYHTGSPADLGWVGSFLLLAVAGCYRVTPAASRPRSTEVEAKQPAPATMLPYLPLLLAVLVLSIRRLQGHSIDNVEFTTVAAAVVMVLLRQYITVRENRELLVAIASREAQLHQQAFHDRLTGLANRALFLNRVEHALQLHRRGGRPLALLFCDLDDFKTVNDSLGHGAGDSLLVQVADRLRTTLRPGDTLARLGGDEFAVLLEDGGAPATVAERMVLAMQAPFDVAGAQFPVQVSVGIAEVLTDHSTPSVDGLVSHADMAMYSAKRAGKGRFATYSPSMLAPHFDDLRLRQPLAQAIADGRIALHFQPIVQLDSGRIVGLEAHPRWTHQGVAVPPEHFLPIAARAGLLNALTTGVLDAACYQVGDWSYRLGHHRLRVGVNLAPSLVTDPEFPYRVADILARNQLKPHQLVLEITEEAFLEDSDTAGVVAHRLRELGVQLALDHFGQGYSSLLRLQQIPLQSLKIDPAFISNIDTDAVAAKFVSAILTLGRNLDILVLADGVERPAQARLLADLGCALAQGSFFRRSEPASEVELYLFGPSGQSVAVTQAVGSG